MSEERYGQVNSLGRYSRQRGGEETAGPPGACRRDTDHGWAEARGTVKRNQMKPMVQDELKEGQ